MNREMAFFIIPLLKTAGKRYAFIDKWKKEDMEKSKIPLPVCGERFLSKPCLKSKAKEAGL